MFVRLKKQNRARAGWLVALLYLFCVVAPGAALALGSTAPWLANDLNPPVSMHAHDHSAHQHSEAHADRDAGSGSTHHQHQHDGKNSTGPCCAMLCLSTIAADTPSIARPVQPSFVRMAETFWRLPDKTPPLPYKPPIV